MCWEPNTSMVNITITFWDSASLYKGKELHVKVTWKCVFATSITATHILNPIKKQQVYNIVLLSLEDI